MDATHTIAAEDAVRRVILHADDFGMNTAVNDGILRAFAGGLLTSTSLLANAPYAAAALRSWKELSGRQAAGLLPSAPARRKLSDPPRPFDLGVHLNLTQGRPLTGSRYPIELLDDRGRFPGPGRLFLRLQLGRRFRRPIENELDCQVQMLLDHGVEPSHLNGHQYVEMMPAVVEIVPRLLERFRIKVVRVAVERSLVRSALLGRGCWGGWLLAGVKQAYAVRFRSRMRAIGARHPDGFCGLVDAGGTDFRRMRSFLSCRHDFHTLEIGLHPATAAAEATDTAADGWNDPLAPWRPTDVETLISPELPRLLEEHCLGLGRLADLAGRPSSTWAVAG
jgi:chitin disaccharide deacetylase